MATPKALAIRHTEAVAALHLAAGKLAQLADIDAPDPAPHKDPQIAEIQRLEALGQFLDALVKAYPKPAKRGKGD
jgi:hypothetical protein